MYKYSNADYSKISNTPDRLAKIEAAIENIDELIGIGSWNCTPQGATYWARISNSSHTEESLAYLSDMKKYFTELNYEFAGADYSTTDFQGFTPTVAEAIKDHRYTGAFYWQSTPQGHKYWESIYDNGSTDESIFYLKEIQKYLDSEKETKEPTKVEETIYVGGWSYTLSELKELYESSDRRVTELVAENRELEIQKGETDQYVEGLRQEIIELGIENADLSAAIPEIKVKKKSWWPKLV